MHLNIKNCNGCAFVYLNKHFILSLFVSYSENYCQEYPLKQHAQAKTNWIGKTSTGFTHLWKGHGKSWNLKFVFQALKSHGN